MRSWLLKKEWVDRDPHLDAVHIHYLYDLCQEAPDWDNPHEQLVMPLPRATNGFALATNDQVRRRVLALPDTLWDPERQEDVAHYWLHYFFEVVQAGRGWRSETFCDEITYRNLEYIDWEGRLSAVELSWAVGDWDAPICTPTEDPRFLATFGEHHERCAERFDRFADKARFALEKWNLMKQLPLPWRWTGRIYAPKGATVRQRWHIGNRSPGMNWEDWDPHPPGDFVHFL